MAALLLLCHPPPPLSHCTLPVVPEAATLVAGEESVKRKVPSSAGYSHAYGPAARPVWVGLLVILSFFCFSRGAVAAEFGAGPWIKGATDVFAGVVPSEPGWYSRTDVYHYNADVGTTIFNGRIGVA